MCVPPLSVRHRQPAEELGHLLALAALRPDHEVPVIVHHDITQDPQRHALVGFGDDRFKRRKVGRPFEQPGPATRAVQHVIGVATNDCSCTSGHVRDCTAGRQSPSRKRLPSPFKTAATTGERSSIGVTILACPHSFQGPNPSIRTSGQRPTRKETNRRYHPLVIFSSADRVPGPHTARAAATGRVARTQGGPAISAVLDAAGPFLPRAT